MLPINHCTKYSGKRTEMSLFDLQPITMDEIRMRQPGDGQTIRKLSGGMTPKLRTIRHKPWYLIVGAGSAGETCRTCAFAVSSGNAGKYKKCGKQHITHGPGTDIRMKDAACRLFEQVKG